MLSCADSSRQRLLADWRIWLHCRLFLVLAWWIMEVHAGWSLTRGELQFRHDMLSLLFQLPILVLGLVGGIHSVGYFRDHCEGRRVLLVFLQFDAYVHDMGDIGGSSH